LPKDPILDGNAPPSAAAMFQAASASATGGPCLMEPEIGSMFPSNWLRPRFRWIGDGALGPGGGPGNQNLFELRLHVENQANDLVVYTTASSWTMPKAMWDGLRTHSAGVAMTLTVRGGVLQGSALASASAGSSGPIAIAPVEAPGTIVYWTTTAGGASDAGYNPELKGFHVGDESVADVLRPSQMAPNDAGPVKCVGCHTSTPDGQYAVATIRPAPSGGGFTQIGFGAVDGSAGTPPYVTAAAQALLFRSEQEAPSFSPAHFTTGDRIAISMYRTKPGFDIIWTDLETTSQAQDVGWGIFKRDTDPGYAALANVSHDGKSIVYVSTPDQDTAGTQFNTGRLYTIPYNDRKGGAAAALAGTHADGFREFYPSYSPDDAFVVYDRSPESKTQQTYDDPNAEIHVVPASGGTPVRLAANDPPACSGAKSPGTYNSWPKWSPEVGTSGTKKYYFLVFSSARNNGTARFGARLYVTPVVVEGSTVTTYAALYLWNQPDNEDNHSPAWDTLQIPDVITK
jgi:hypothetical protein